MDLVSVIIPLHNAATTITAALDSVSQQTYSPLEVCVCDDASTDGGLALVHSWAASHPHIAVRCYPVQRSAALGPAYARNRAASLAQGMYLCFLDADDICLPCRVALQVAAAAQHPGALIGASFTRDPADATPRYTAWANSLSDQQLVQQSWRECTLIQPTWLLPRALFLQLGGYDEVGPQLHGQAEAPYAFPCLDLDPQVPAAGAGGAASAPAPPPPAPSTQHPAILARPPLKLRPESLAALPGAPPLPPTFTPFPEDPLLFHRLLAAAAAAATPTPTPLHRVPTPCLSYRFSAHSLTWRVSRAVLLAAKVALFEERVLLPSVAAAAAAEGGGVAGERGAAWYIWGAGRDGKAFYKALSPAGKAACRGFLDIDAGKIGQVYPPPVGRRAQKRSREGEGEGGQQEEALLPLPIRHFSSLGEAVGGGAGGSSSSSSSPACFVAVCVAMDSAGQELLDNVDRANQALVARGGRALVEGSSLFFLC